MFIISGQKCCWLNFIALSQIKQPNPSTTTHYAYKIFNTYLKILGIKGENVNFPSAESLLARILSIWIVSVIEWYKVNDRSLQEAKSCQRFINLPSPSLSIPTWFMLKPWFSGAFLQKQQPIHNPRRLGNFRATSVCLWHSTPRQTTRKSQYRNSSLYLGRWVRWRSRCHCGCRCG